MRKFFGVLLVVIGSIIALFCIIAVLPEATSGADIIGLIIWLIPSALIIWLGVKLIKPKKEKIKKAVHTQSQDSYVTKSSLSEVRQLTEDKLAQIPSSGYRFSAEQTTISFLNLNDEKIPFEFEGSQTNNVDLVTNWKLADTDYLGMLGMSKHNIQQEFKVLMKFDEQNGEIRCLDKAKAKSSGFSPLGGGMEFSTFSGKQSSVQKQIVFGKKKDGSIGKVADIKLDTKILHNAIEQVAEKCGWKVKRVIKL